MSFERSKPKPDSPTAPSLDSGANGEGKIYTFGNQEELGEFVTDTRFAYRSRRERTDEGVLQIAKQTLEIELELPTPVGKWMTLTTDNGRRMDFYWSGERYVMGGAPSWAKKRADTENR